MWREPQRFTWEWYLWRKDKSKESFRISEPERSKPGPIRQEAEHITEDLWVTPEGRELCSETGGGETFWTAVWHGSGSYANR